jgi:hypothetical protein
MHAVVVNVTINEPEAAIAHLRDEIVPGVSQASGFVAAYWTRSQDDKGMSVLVFESEEAAQGMAQQIEQPDTDVVTLDGVEVREVVANA